MKFKNKTKVEVIWLKILDYLLSYDKSLQICCKTCDTFLTNFNI